MLLQRLVRIRKLVEWGPLIVVAALSSDYLHLSLILATSLSAGGVLIDYVLRKAGAIKEGPVHSSCSALALSLHSHCKKHPDVPKWACRCGPSTWTCTSSWSSALH